MELVERISALENEQKLVKSEIKKVLIDLREMMNTAENPFSYLEQLQEAGVGGVDRKRLEKLEEDVKQLKEMGMDGGNEIEERIKKLEETMEELKEFGNGIDEEKLKNLEDDMQELKELSNAEVEQLRNLEAAIEKLAEAETETQTQLQSEKPIIHNPMTAASAASASESESEPKKIGTGTAGMGIGSESAIVDTVTLAQLMQWADTTLNLIGAEKLNQIVELYELTGCISREMKNTILKVAELPDAVLSPEKGHIEMRHCIIALLDLHRILTGEHHDLFALLEKLCNDYNCNPLSLNENEKKK
ncbi:MAG: hypothetical protein J7I99_02620 [Methanophagales archaeon]|nr:hypothetical protein [Methanophagales archaeon]